MSATSAAQAAGGGAEPTVPEPWHDDKPDEWSAQIEAAHPIRSKAYAAYDTAMKMVGNRRDKHALVELVCWLLQRAAPDHPSPSREGPSDAEMLTFLLAHCKVVYYPTGSGYPVEHNPFALGYPKDGAFLLGALRAAMKEHQP